MSFIVDFFKIILYEPLLNILVLLYKYLPGHDFGVAVVVLTVIIKFLTFPLGTKAIKSQKALSDLQPKIKEIQERYKNDRAGQAKATMELYKAQKINPFSGFLPVLIQLPILIALYQVFWRGLDPNSTNHFYSFISLPEQINPYFLGIINMAKPSGILAILAGISQFFQTKITIPKIPKSQKGDTASQFSNIMQKQMLYFFPIFTILIVWKLPSAIALYWIVTSIFAIIQQYFVLKKKDAG